MRYVGFRGDNIACQPERFSEVCVSTGDDSADVRTVVFVIKKFDDLFGYGPAFVSATVRWHDEDVVFAHHQRFFGWQ